jgi:hypothetical protein
VAAERHFAVTSQAGTWSYEQMGDWQRQAGPAAEGANPLQDDARHRSAGGNENASECGSRVHGDFVRL